MKEKDAEIYELRANIEELRTLLENETLCKVDLQNNLQSLNEELSFRKKIYEEVSPSAQVTPISSLLWTNYETQVVACAVCMLAR